MTGAYTTHRPPTTRDGLISYWRFNDGAGKTAFDAQGNNDAKLSDAGLMVNFKPTAANWFYVNGESSNVTQYADSTSSVGGYGSEQFNFGYVDRTSIGFSGQLDEVRIWDTQLTQEQINDSMNRALSGSEPGLMGLWGFESGSGATLLDNTGRGNTGTLTAGSGSPPTSRAPATAALDVLGRCVAGGGRHRQRPTGEEGPHHRQVLRRPLLAGVVPGAVQVDERGVGQRAQIVQGRGPGQVVAGGVGSRASARPSGSGWR
jgi:Concanavalin A-like lectin/glucanases superfamily